MVGGWKRRMYRGSRRRLAKGIFAGLAGSTFIFRTSVILGGSGVYPHEHHARGKAAVARFDCTGIGSQKMKDYFNIVLLVLQPLVKLECVQEMCTCCCRREIALIKQGRHREDRPWLSMMC